MATTVKEFTVDIDESSDSTCHVELRNSGSKYWARATPDIAFTPYTVGTVKLQKRERTVATGNAGAWSTMKSATVTQQGGQVWTDENYDPPNSTSSYYVEICAALTHGGVTTRTGYVRT